MRLNAKLVLSKEVESELSVVARNVDALAVGACIRPKPCGIKLGFKILKLHLNDMTPDLSSSKLRLASAETLIQSKSKFLLCDSLDCLI